MRKDGQTSRCAGLTFGVLQQEEDCVLRDDKLLQLHHVGHGVRHDGLPQTPTVTALPHTLPLDRGRRRR